VIPGYLAQRALPDGRLVAVGALFFGRARLVLGDVDGVDDQW
jgi:hypothetical protein